MSLIPDKLYFKIGEVSQITKLKAYVLRYWQTEFPEIAPAKSKTNQRMYKKKDVELILKIKELLYEEKLTIKGARKKLKKELKDSRKDDAQLGLLPEKKQPALDVEPVLKGMREVLASMKNFLREVSV